MALASSTTASSVSSPHPLELEALTSGDRLAEQTVNFLLFALNIHFGEEGVANIVN